jgi:hypothetical protein
MLIIVCRPEDVPEAQQVRILLAELREERQKKARAGVRILNHHVTMVHPHMIILLILYV